MGTFGALNPPLVAVSTLRPLLQAGAQYWVIATADVATWAAWNQSTIGDTGPHAASGSSGPPFDVSNVTSGAFRVDASPVPEPGTLLLLGGGLCGLAARRRRRAS